MSFLNAILIAVALFALLAGLGILFGVFEYTTDKEFKTYKFLRSSYRRLPIRERNCIFALAAVLALVYFASTQLVNVAWLNWTLLVVAIGIEVYYLMWTIRISDRIRELVVGGALLLATWPIFSSLCANLCSSTNIDSGPIGWVKLFVVGAAIALVVVVCYRLCSKLDPAAKSRFHLEDFIRKEEKTHEA